MEVLGSSLSFSLGQKQLCAKEPWWKGFNKVVTLLLVLPVLLLPHFTNVWMPLMRNQDHSRGPQWSRSCDNLLFRCWLAIEMGAGSDWNCICLSVGLWGGYSAFTPVPLKRASQVKVQRAICGANLFFAFHATLCYGWFFFVVVVFNILHLIAMKQDTASSIIIMWQWCRTLTNTASVRAATWTLPTKCSLIVLKYGLWCLWRCLSLRN